MKTIHIFLAALCLIPALSGCAAGGKQNDDENKTRLGMSVVATAKADEEQASVDAVVAAVLTDEDGTILACRLDEIEVQPQLVNGHLQDETDFRTKQEKGDAYGMKKAGAKQEWYQQAEAFCKYTVGKTAAEVAAIETTDGKATDADLSAGCTIEVTDFMKAVSDAAQNAKEQQSMSSDRLGVAMTASRYTGSDDDAPRYDLIFSAVSVGADGKLTGCVVDELQKSFAVTGGVFVENTAASSDVKTKKQLGNDYGMKAASAIGKEWYEQADHLQKQLTDKSAQEIDRLPLTDGKATDADITAGCTVAVSGLLANVQKAMKTAA